MAKLIDREGLLHLFFFFFALLQRKSGMVFTSKLIGVGMFVLFWAQGKGGVVCMYVCVHVHTYIHPYIHNVAQGCL